MQSVRQNSRNDPGLRISGSRSHKNRVLGNRVIRGVTVTRLTEHMDLKYEQTAFDGTSNIRSSLTPLHLSRQPKKPGAEQTVPA